MDAVKLQRLQGQAVYYWNRWDGDGKTEIVK